MTEINQTTYFKTRLSSFIRDNINLWCSDETSPIVKIHDLREKDFQTWPQRLEAPVIDGKPKRDYHYHHMCTELMLLREQVSFVAKRPDGIDNHELFKKLLAIKDEWGAVYAVDIGFPRPRKKDFPEIREYIRHIAFMDSEDAVTYRLAA